MPYRASLIAAALAALAVAFPGAAAAAAEPPAAPQLGLGTALVARSLQVPSPRRHRPAAASRLRHLLWRTLRRDGFERVHVSCRTRTERVARCRVDSAHRAGAAWSGRALVRTARLATRISYRLESRPAA
ncbi:MAG TPA: hypothetical protein VLA98_01060 [Solirubrobacteraceae bacterium]|nr:hypothetical protein [Solirubrobacteraceae bacterium]